MERSRKEIYKEAWERGVARGQAVGDTRHTVAERLRLLRMQRGFTQKDIADMANINQTTYSGYENKIAQPTVAVLIRIADVYEVSLDYLAGRSDNIYGLYANNLSDDNNSGDELLSRISAIEKVVEQLKNSTK